MFKKNSGENGHLCLVPDLTGNAFGFSPLRMKGFTGKIKFRFYLRIIKVNKRTSEN